VQDPNSEAIQEPNITVDNAEYKIVSANDEHPLPDGYTPTEYDYNGTKVSAGVGVDYLFICHIVTGVALYCAIIDIVSEPACFSCRAYAVE
jgi:hypothetical protein